MRVTILNFSYGTQVYIEDKHTKGQFTPLPHIFSNIIEHTQASPDLQITQVSDSASPKSGIYLIFLVWITLKISFYH